MSLAVFDPADARLDALADLSAHTDNVVAALLEGDGPVAFDDTELMRMLALAGGVLRRIEAVLVEATGEVTRRSAMLDRDVRLTTRFGCHDVSELVQRATLAAPATTARWQRAARSVMRETSPSSGEWLPAPLPAIRAALLDGALGVDGVLAVTGALADLDRRVPRDAVLDADGALAAAARGEGPDAAPPACADLLRVHATAWSMMLDPDGAEPREQAALRRRGVSLGAPRHGLVPIRGDLMPEVAAQLQPIFDAVCSPRVDDAESGVRFRPDADGNSGGPSPADARSWRSGAATDERRAPQKRHDALATALLAAAASGELPTIGGAAPTLVVSVRETDLAGGRGWVHVEGSGEPMSAHAARCVACTGSVQRIALNAEGRVLRLGTEERDRRRATRASAQSRGAQGHGAQGHCAHGRRSGTLST